MAQGYTNDFSTTLSSSYTAGGGSLSVASTSGLPASGYSFYLKIDSEYFLCTSYSGSTLTVTGAQAGSTAANHANGAGVTACWVLPAMLDGVRSDIHQTGSITSLPTTPRQGDIYYPTDSIYDSLIYNSAAWQYQYRGMKVTPPAGTFAWINQGSSTVTKQTNGVWSLNAPSNGASDSFRIYDMAAPSTPYTKIFRFRASIYAQNYSAVGIVFRESATGKLVVFEIGYQDADQINGLHPLVWVRVAKFNSPTSYNSVYSGNEQQQIALLTGASEFCFKVGDDGTNLTFSWSNDNGINFFNLLTVARNDFLTTAPDHVGMALNPNNQVGSQPCGLTLISMD